MTKLRKKNAYIRLYSYLCCWYQVKALRDCVVFELFATHAQIGLCACVGQQPDVNDAVVKALRDVKATL